jgi:hypothetical protein
MQIARVFLISFEEMHHFVTSKDSREHRGNTEKMPPSSSPVLNSPMPDRSNMFFLAI